jgi:type I restriction enzyme S subunit
MAASYKKVIMRDLCEITSSKRIFAADYQANGVPFYRGKEITEKYKGNLEVSTELFISRCKFEEIKAKFGAPNVGDLLLTSVGTLGSPYVVKHGEEFYFKDGNLTWFRNFNNLDSQFLYYWLISPFGKAELYKSTIGVAQSAFTIALLKEMEIELPPIPTQRRIASILSAYDELIENNLRRIRILEDMARSLYREWFVHFRYPGHESVPLVDSPLRQIPKGWEVKKLKDVCLLTMGQSPKSEFYNDSGDGVPFHQGVTNFGTRFPSDRLYCTVDGRIAEAGDILFSVRAPVGRMNIANKRIIIGRGLSAIRHKQNYQVFLWQQLRETFYKDDMMGNGAIFAAVTKDDMQGIELLCPADSIIQLATQHLEPMHHEIANLSVKIENLRRTRDLLLPRLLSGQVALSTDTLPATA